MLFSRNASKADSHIICSRIFCRFVIDAVRVRAFHPNIHSKNHSVIADSLGYCLGTRNVILSVFRSAPSAICIRLDMLVRGSNGCSGAIDARPSVNCRSVIPLAFDGIGGIDAFQILCSSTVTIRIGILNRQSNTQGFGDGVSRGITVDRYFNGLFRRIRQIYVCKSGIRNRIGCTHLLETHSASLRQLRTLQPCHLR